VSWLGFRYRRDPYAGLTSPPREVIPQPRPSAAPLPPPAPVSVRGALEAFADRCLENLDDCELREKIRADARWTLLNAGRRPPEGEEWAFWWEELVHLVGRRRELDGTGVPRVGEQGIEWDQRIGDALAVLCGGAP
jgi:hypothetical protein